MATKIVKVVKAPTSSIKQRNVDPFVQYWNDVFSGAVNSPAPIPEDILRSIAPPPSMGMPMLPPEPEGVAPAAMPGFSSEADVLAIEQQLAELAQEAALTNAQPFPADQMRRDLPPQVAPPLFAPIPGRNQGEEQQRVDNAARAASFLPLIGLLTGNYGYALRTTPGVMAGALKGAESRNNRDFEEALQAWQLATNLQDRDYTNRVQARTAQVGDIDFANDLARQTWLDKQAANDKRIDNRRMALNSQKQVVLSRAGAERKQALASLKAAIDLNKNGNLTDAGREKVAQAIAKFGGMSGLTGADLAELSPWQQGLLDKWEADRKLRGEMQDKQIESTEEQKQLDRDLRRSLASETNAIQRERNSIARERNEITRRTKDSKGKTDPTKARKELAALEGRIAGLQSRKAAISKSVAPEVPPWGGTPVPKPKATIDEARATIKAIDDSISTIRAIADQVRSEVFTDPPVEAEFGPPPAARPAGYGRTLKPAVKPKPKAAPARTSKRRDTSKMSREEFVRYYAERLLEKTKKR